VFNFSSFKLNYKHNHFFLAGAFPLAPFAASASSSFYFSAQMISSSGVLIQAPSITTFSNISSSCEPLVNYAKT